MRIIWRKIGIVTRISIATLLFGYSLKLTTNFILMRLVFLSETSRCVSMKAESARLMPNPHQSRSFILLWPIHRRTPIQKDMKGVYYATEKNQLKRRVGKSINMGKGQCEYADQKNGVAVKFQTILKKKNLSDDMFRLAIVQSSMVRIKSPKPQ